MKSQINVLLPVGSGKVFNVFRPKIDCRVGGNSCFVSLKTQPPPSHLPVIVFFAVHATHGGRRLLSLFTHSYNIQHVTVHLYSAACVKLVKSR